MSRSCKTSALNLPGAWETDGGRGHETSVVIEFTPCSDGTELQLTHQVFESLESRDAHSGGWSVVSIRWGTH